MRKNELVNNWSEHPWSKTGMVELIPTKILALIANQKPSNTTDDLDGKIKPVDKVWQSILENGMRDPLLIVLNIHQQSIRLEAGNHRIQQALASGITHLPVATLVMPIPIIHLGNGSHYYRANGMVDFEGALLQPYPYQVKLTEMLIGKYGELNEADWELALKHI